MLRRSDSFLITIEFLRSKPFRRSLPDRLSGIKAVYSNRRRSIPIRFPPLSWIVSSNFVLYKGRIFAVWINKWLSCLSWFVFRRDGKIKNSINTERTNPTKMMDSMVMSPATNLITINQNRITNYQSPFNSGKWHREIDSLIKIKGFLNKTNIICLYILLSTHIVSGRLTMLSLG